MSPNLYFRFRSLNSCGNLVGIKKLSVSKVQIAATSARSVKATNSKSSVRGLRSLEMSYKLPLITWGSCGCFKATKGNMNDLYLLGHSFVRNNMTRRSPDQTSKACDGLNYLSSSETRGSIKKQGNSFETLTPFIRLFFENFVRQLTTWLWFALLRARTLGVRTRNLAKFDIFRTSNDPTR